MKKSKNCPELLQASQSALAQVGVSTVEAEKEGGCLSLLCTADETMQALGVTKRQLYHLVQRGLLKKHPAFRSLVFTKKDVQAFAPMT